MDELIDDLPQSSRRDLVELLRQAAEDADHARLDEGGPFDTPGAGFKAGYVRGLYAAARMVEESKQA